MFRIIKALNNNSILVLSNETKREYILMGSGIGFGKMPGQQIESIKGAKVYSLVTRKKKQSALKAVWKSPGSSLIWQKKNFPR